MVTGISNNIAAASLMSNSLYFIEHLSTTTVGKARQSANKSATYVHPGQLFFSKEKRRSVLGGIQTNNTLQSRLYQLSYKGQLSL